MKLVTVRFEDTVDIQPLVKGEPVTVGQGTYAVTGTLMSKTDMEDPPELAGDYHITPI